MPPDLRRLLALFLDDIATQSAGIGAGQTTVDTWQKQMALSLLTFGYASYMDGAGTRELTPQEQALVNRLVGEQLDYLNRFANELDARGWEDKDASRAALYGGSIKAVFWRGRTRGYEIPNYPGDGSTECLVNCRCFLEINELDQEELNADVYWRLSDAEHCSQCVERSRQWAPLRFREGAQV